MWLGKSGSLGRWVAGCVRDCVCVGRCVSANVVSAYVGGECECVGECV